METSLSSSMAVETKLMYPVLSSEHQTAMRWCSKTRSLEVGWEEQSLSNTLSTFNSVLHLEGERATTLSLLAVGQRLGSVHLAGKLCPLYLLSHIQLHGKFAIEQGRSEGGSAGGCEST
jgi:hypothetical protein